MPEPSDRRRAVALRYHQEKDAAPRVLAKGSGDVAERIIALAREHGVPLHEDRDLIGLLGALELDEMVPPALYVVLAEVLAHVYRANRTAPPGGSGRGTSPRGT